MKQEALRTDHPFTGAEFLESLRDSREVWIYGERVIITTSLTTPENAPGVFGPARIAMLADLYNWFSEGFDTADLKDAETLLDELAG
jgi:hypothetical protein